MLNLFFVVVLGMNVEGVAIATVVSNMISSGVDIVDKITLANVTPITVRHTPLISATTIVVCTAFLIDFSFPFPINVEITTMKRREVEVHKAHCHCIRKE